jgi:hypothetical protein
MEWWKEPFFQVALPVIVSFAFATWFQSKRIDDLKDAISKRLDSIELRLVSIESLLKDHDRRITTLEARTPPIYTR